MVANVTNAFYVANQDKQNAQFDTRYFLCSLMSVSLVTFNLCRDKYYKRTSEPTVMKNWVFYSAISKSVDPLSSPALASIPPPTPPNPCILYNKKPA